MPTELFKAALKGSASKIKNVKEVKGIQFGKVEIEPALFAYDMITPKSRDYVNKLSYLIKE